MDSTRTWILAGTAGALMGAVSMYYVAVGNTHTQACMENSQAVAAPAGTGKLEALPRPAGTAMPTSFTNAQTLQAAVSPHTLSTIAQDAKNKSPVAPPTSATVRPPAAADEEGTVQIMSARLHDPAYIYSKTMADIMQSEEMLKLSDQSRERVVQEMVGMINRGEIDARTFMPGEK